MLNNDQKRTVIDLAKTTGERIMAIYAHDFHVDYKDDSSPLTQALAMAAIAYQKTLSIFVLITVKYPRT